MDIDQYMSQKDAWHYSNYHKLHPQIKSFIIYLLQVIQVCQSEHVLS